MSEAALAEFVRCPPLAGLLALLSADGEDARVVGGAVRNLLLGRPVSDVDIATTTTPDETTRRLEQAGWHAVPTGIEHGTVTAVRGDQRYEVTTLREDIETDGRHAVVRFGRDFAQDAARRDFTMNALYVDRHGRLHDPVGGLPDLRAGRVRFIGDARQRLREDHLRGLRLFRFHAVYGQPGQLDPEAYAAAVADRDGLAGLARERVRQELLKLVVAPGAGLALEAMAEGRLLDAVLLCTANLPAFHQVVLLEQAVRLAPDASRRLLALCGLRAGIGTLAEALRLTRAEVRRLRAVHRIGAMPGWPELPGEPPLSPDDAVRHAVLVHGQETVLDALLLLRPTPQRRLLAQLSLAAGFSPPRRPYDGALMLALGLEPGPAMAKALAALDRAWIAAGLPLQPETIHQLAASVCRRGDGSDTEAGTDDSRPS